MASFVGRKVSHYKILEQIGRGGMGLVYKAEDLTLGRTVAVKFFPPDAIPDTPSRERFIREAQAASSLDHANVCTIHEIGETPDGDVFIVMGYYEGETLRQKIEHGPLPLAEALQIGIQVCAGLAKVHEKGIIHRDIKPANVIVTHDGDARILDFGVASLSGGAQLTRTGHSVGTVLYMAPEQAQGAPVDARSDLFSLGAILYEMTTGNRPFTGDHEAAVMYSIVHLDPPAPSSVNRKIPPAVDGVILRLLDKHPDRRYQSARELRSDLVHLAGVTGSGGIVPVPAQRVRLRAIAGVAALIVGVALIGWLVLPRLFPGAVKKTPWRLAVLPFHTITRNPGAADWPPVVQMMMVDHLNGVEELRVIDPLTFASIAGGGETNALAAAKRVDAGLLINGTIESLDTSYALRCTLTDVADGLVKFSDVETFSADRDLPLAVQRISGQILNYFQIETLSGSGREREDVQPWLNHRTKNLEAIKAFLQGAQLMARWQPGGDVYFRKAIEIDSTFVTPRTWLIAGLVNRGNIDEARPHQAYLLRHIFEAGPFEQALVRWTGAMIGRDLVGQAKALEEALEYSPRNDVLLFLLADIRSLQQDYAGSAEAIRPAVESGWTFQPASFMLGWNLLRLKEYAECRRVLERSLKFEAVDPETYAILAAVAQRDGETEAADGYAAEFLRRAQAGGVAADSGYALLGDNCSLAGANAGASASYAKAIELNPRKAAYQLGLARAELALGDTRGAQAAAERALAIDRMQSGAHDLLGQLYDLRADTALALRHYMTALAGDSTAARAGEIRLRIRQLLRR